MKGPDPLGVVLLVAIALSFVFSAASVVLSLVALFRSRR